jgi:hypothetical protein
MGWYKVTKLLKVTIVGKAMPVVGELFGGKVDLVATKLKRHNRCRVSLIVVGAQYKVRGRT